MPGADFADRPPVVGDRLRIGDHGANGTDFRRFLLLFLAGRQQAGRTAHKNDQSLPVHGFLSENVVPASALRCSGRYSAHYTLEV